MFSGRVESADPGKEHGREGGREEGGRGRGTSGWKRSRDAEQPLRRDPRKDRNYGGHCEKTFPHLAPPPPPYPPPPPPPL